MVSPTYFIRRAVGAIVVALLPLMLATSPAAADDAIGASGPSMRPEIGKPIQEAQDFLKATKGREALARVHDADAVTGKSTYETYVVELTKGQAASLAGDPETAGAAFDAAAAAAPSGTAELLAAAAGQYYSAMNYAKVIEACARYFKEGGSDQALHTLRVQSLYLSGDLAKAGRELHEDIQVTEAAGRAPVEQQLLMLADISNRQNDAGSFTSTMEKLVTHYPKKDYWASLVYSVSTRPGLSTQLALDVLRLKLATGTMRGTEDYVEAAQLAIQAGFPAEAKTFIDAGHEAHLMGNGEDAGRHKRLRDAVTKGLAEDTRTLGQGNAKMAAAATGEPLMNAGLNYVLRGQAGKGLPMMERAFKMGGFKRVENARLHLGVAQFLAGQKTKAVETLRAVKGADGSAEIARLWVLLARPRR